MIEKAQVTPAAAWVSGAPLIWPSVWPDWYSIQQYAEDIIAAEESAGADWPFLIGYLWI